MTHLSRSSRLAMSLSYVLAQKGQLNLPGITQASKTTAEELLLKDAEEHHCFFRSSGFHNHLSHHILAAYDLGSPAGHLRTIYADVAKIQRPILLEEQDKSIQVNQDNWKQYLGNHNAYGSFVKFYSNAIAELGVAGTLEKYVLGEEAAAIGMPNRLMGGAVHPIIAVGYGLEFGNDTIVATGIAQAAVHDVVSNFHVNSAPPAKNVTLLELLEQVNESEILKPGPYSPAGSPETFFRTMKSIINNGTAEIERLCAGWHISDTISDTELMEKAEELVFVGTLLTFSTGRKGRTPRLDFFLMHLLTSSLFIKPYCRVIRKPEHKALLLRTYVAEMVLLLLLRGRPRIDGNLIMEFNPVPRPPLKDPYPTAVKESLGGPGNDAEYNPWPALVEGVQYHPDSHVLKAMRSLVYGAVHFGTVSEGGVIGAFRTDANGNKVETHPGLAKVDGTIFVRSAGVMMDLLGWTGLGQHANDWDRTSLGWDEAWEEGVVSEAVRVYKS